MNWIDGVNCINVYSRGKTELGRLLSNFAHTPFSCDDGQFESVEGYWYWLSTKDNRLRRMWGVEAKKYGRKVRGEDWPKGSDFEEKIKAAICKKIVQNKLYNMMAASELPFVHYYEYDGGTRTMVDNGSGWMMMHLESCRKKLKDAGFPKEHL